MTEAPRNIHDLLRSGEVAKPEVLLGMEDKEAYAAAGTEFTVTSVQMGDDKQYGPFWEVKATIDHEPVSFRLSQHSRRDAFMSGLAAATASGPIGGLRLTAYPGQGGNAFIQLEPS